jgi:hypothetical protein
MPRLRFIHNPTTGKHRWEHVSEEKNFNDEIMTIETSLGIISLKTHQQEHNNSKNSKMKYASYKQRKKSQRSTYVYEWSESELTLMDCLWTRTPVEKLRYLPNDDFELYDPIENKWHSYEYIWDKRDDGIKLCRDVLKNILEYTLSKKDEAEGDHEFHEQERASVEETFSEIVSVFE